MRRINRRKVLAVFMAIAMVFCYIPTTAVADSVPGTFKDMPQEGFWSTAALEAAVNNGLLNGFVESDGTYIKPNDPLTRAQMATIVNRAFGAETKAALTGVADVASDAWFSGDMQKAVQMGTMKLDTLMRPNDSITRQEAFTILARAFKMNDGTTTDVAGFSDGNKVASWALPGMGALVKAGYVQGSDNMLTPTAQMTRAQFAIIMNNMIQDYITQAGTVTAAASGNVMVNVPGVTLKDVTIQGDLIVGDGVGEGNVTLDNVTIKGNLIARGGGINSIIIVGGSVDGKVIIAKVDGQVRVSVEGDASVEVIVIDDGKDDVIIEGTVGTVEVTAPDTPVIVQNATATNIEVKSEGAAKVTIASNSTVTNVVVGTGSTGTTLNVEGKVTNVETSAANTEVSGTGTVSTVKAKEGADNTKVTTPSTKVTNDGTTGVVAGGGTEVPAGSTATNSNTGNDATVLPTTGGGSTGGGGDVIPPVVSGLDSEINSHVVTRIHFTSNEVGTYYFLILQSGDATPSAAVVKAQGVSESKGTGAVVANENTVTIQGLNAGDYKVHIVVEDGSGNQSAVTSSEFTVSVTDAVVNATQIASHSSIQAAIDDSYAEDVIYVSGGAYNLTVPIVIDKGVTLIGNSDNPAGVVLNAPVSGDDREIFQIQSDDVTIQGFTIQGAKDVQKGTSWNSNPGIAVGGDKLMIATKPAIATMFNLSGTADYWGYAVENITIRDNIICDNSYGIFLFHAQSVIIENNVIRDNTRDANTWSGKGIEVYTSLDLYTDSKAVGGVGLPHTNDILINNNSIYDNKLFGIELNHAEAYHGGVGGPFDVNVRITNNDIYNNGGPMDAVGQAYDYSRGITSNSNETNVTILGNTIYGHTATSGARFKADSAGIRIPATSGWTIEDNEIYGNTRGVYAYAGSTDITIGNGNVIRDNAQGVVFGGYSTGTVEADIWGVGNSEDGWIDDGLLPSNMVYLVGTASDFGDVLSNNVDALAHITANISSEAITVAAATKIFIPNGKTLTAETSICNSGEIIIDGTLNIVNGTVGMEGYGEYKVSDSGSILMGGQPYIAATGALKVSSGAIWLNQNTSGGATYVVPSGSEVVIQGANESSGDFAGYFLLGVTDSLTVESESTLSIGTTSGAFKGVALTGIMEVPFGVDDNLEDKLFTRKNANGSNWDVGDDDYVITTALIVDGTDHIITGILGFGGHETGTWYKWTGTEWELLLPE